MVHMPLVLDWVVADAASVVASFEDNRTLDLRALRVVTVFYLVPAVPVGVATFTPPLSPVR